MKHQMLTCIPRQLINKNYNPDHAIQPQLPITAKQIQLDASRVANCNEQNAQWQMQVIASLAAMALVALFIIGWVFYPIWLILAAASTALGAIGWRLRWRGVALLGLFCATVFIMLSLGILWTRVLFPAGIAACLVVPLGWTWDGHPNLRWFKWGRLNGRLVVVTIGLAILSAAAVMLLVRWTGQAVVLPAWIHTLPPLVLLAGAVAFAAGNALMEECVFRGIIMTGVQAEAGKTLAVIAQAVAFGATHGNGVPGGTSGMIAAGLFGAAMGILRYHSKGLAAPWLCHFLVDTAIALYAVWML